MSDVGEVGILNVGAGDVKINFNSDDPAEVIRAERIVTDMLRRGYALLVIDDDGRATRATAFDPKTHEYTIADYDPTPRGRERNAEANEEIPAEEEKPPQRAATRKVKAGKVRAVAVSRTAGG